MVTAGLLLTIAVMATIAYFTVRFAGALNDAGPAPENAESYRNYTFVPQKEGEQLFVSFQPKMLPGDDSTFIGATRHVIQKYFGEKVPGQPATESLNAPDSRIVEFSGSSHRYLVQAFKIDTGEIHTLLIERLPS